MKIALTGSGGFLGSRILEYYEGRELPGEERAHMVPLRSGEVTLTEERAVDVFFAKERPEILIHCGAISDTGACERNPEMSHVVNVEIPKVLAGACRRYGTKMLFCSSDQVYFQEGEPFQKDHFHREEEVLEPKGIYGQQKLQAEREILSRCPNAVCLRLSWMYDWEDRGAKEHGTLIRTVLEQVREGRELAYPVHDYRSITNVWEVVRNLEAAMTLPGGVYNFGSRNEGNTYEVVRGILELIGADSAWLRENVESFRDCPRNLRMDTGKIGQYGIHFLSTSEGMKASKPQGLSAGPKVP